MVQHGIQIIQIEDKTTVINNTPYQILYKPQLSISNPYSGKEVSNPQCGCSLWFYQFTINRLNFFLAWGKEKANSEYRNPVISAGFETSNGKLKLPQWEVSRMLQQPWTVLSSSPQQRGPDAALHDPLHGSGSWVWVWTRQGPSGSRTTGTPCPLCCHSEHAPLSSFQHFHVPDTTTFSISPGGEHSEMKSSSLPCWDFMPDMGPSLDTAVLQKQILLGFSPAPGADSSQCWSLPAVVRREFPRQSVAVPCGTLGENGFCTRYFTRVSMLCACHCCRSSSGQDSSVSVCNSRFSFIFNDF